MSQSYQEAVLRVAVEYEAAVAEHGGRSLSRVATIVVNRGSFFDRLRGGDTFTVRNMEKVAAWFRDPANWPLGEIPAAARAALLSIGRPAVPTEQAAAA